MEMRIEILGMKLSGIGNFSIAIDLDKLRCLVRLKYIDYL